MKPTIPSLSQRFVLEALAKGRTLTWSGKPLLFRLSKPVKTVQTQTVLSMDKEGWLRRTGEEDDYTYSLTALGAAAILLRRPVD